VVGRLLAEKWNEEQRSGRPNGDAH
jgi:hypothetical protein